MRRWTIALLAVTGILLLALIALIIWQRPADPAGVPQSARQGSPSPPPVTTEAAPAPNAAAPPSPTATPSAKPPGTTSGAVSTDARQVLNQRLVAARTREAEAQQRWKVAQEELERTTAAQAREPKNQSVNAALEQARREENQQRQTLKSRSAEVQRVERQIASVDTAISRPPAIDPAPSGKVAADPSSPRTRLDELVSRFKTANGAMAAPEQTTEGTEEKVSLVLSPSGTSAEAVGLAAEAAPRSVAAPLQAKYHELMEAKLTGDGFRIVARTPERQAVPTVEPTRWEWSVVPIKAGRQPLHVALSAVVEAGGDHAPRLVTTFERTVQVAVRPVPMSERAQTFAIKHWEWLLGAIGTVLGATWRAAIWWKNRRKKQDASPSATIGKFE